MSKVQVKVANDRFPIEGSLQLAHDQLLFVSSHALTSLSVLTGTLIPHRGPHPHDLFQTLGLEAPPLVPSH